MGSLQGLEELVAPLDRRPPAEDQGSRLIPRFGPIGRKDLVRALRRLAFAPKPKCFHGSVLLNPTRVGRDASKIADEVVTHLAGLVAAQVKVTLEIDAEIPSGVPENVVRTVTENSRTLKFTTHGFESD